MAYEATFELKEAACELTHKNDRIEKHGEEDVLAIDLNFTWETNNKALALFAPALRSALYMADEPAEGSLPLSDDNASKLRHKHLNAGKAFGWDGGEIIGGELRFHHGVESRSDVVFDKDVKVGKYKLDCRDGGTVVIHFQVQVYPTDKQTAFLSKALVNKICTISITPPKAAAQQALAT